MIINGITKKQIDGFVKKPHGNIVLDGSKESGAQKIAIDLAIELLGVANRLNLIIIKPNDKNTISIDDSRELNKFLSSKIITEEKVGRVAILLNAEAMGIEAQNSLLKITEEPVDKTCIIFQVDGVSRLLTTIGSRCKKIKVLPISKSSIEPGNEKSELAYLLSGGQALLYEDILNNGPENALPTIKNSKEFLAVNTSRRLQFQKSYQNKDDLNSLLKDLKIMTETAIHRSSVSDVKKWAKKLSVVNRCRYLFENGVSTKLIFLRLCVEL